LATKASSLSEQESSRKNIEYRIMNVEYRRKQPFEILRFDILLFCGSLFRPGEVPHRQ
jgi:hypothetical protein